MHYYSVFFLGSLCFAEMVRARLSRKIDWPVFAAFAPGLLVLALHYPLIATSARFQVHYWSPPNWKMIGDFYDVYLPNAAILLLLLGGVILLLKGRMPESGSGSGMRVHELVAIAALSIMPPFVIAVSKYTTHAFVDRYTVWAVIGIALVVVASARVVARASKSFGMALLTVVCLAVLILQARHLHSVPFLRAGEAVSEALETLPVSTEPIVLGNEHVFMELAYYAPESIRKRLVFAVDRQLALDYMQTDTGAMLMAGLRRWSKLPILPLEEVISSHPQFIIEAKSHDYLLPYSMAAGYRVTPIAVSEGLPILFDVDTQAKMKTAQ
jgi:multidrug transporter EmrE-like cation transporter